MSNVWTCPNCAMPNKSGDLGLVRCANPNCNWTEGDPMPIPSEKPEGASRIERLVFALIQSPYAQGSMNTPAFARKLVTLAVEFNVEITKAEIDTGPVLKTFAQESKVEWPTDE